MIYIKFWLGIILNGATSLVYAGGIFTQKDSHCFCLVAMLGSYLYHLSCPFHIDINIYRMPLYSLSIFQ